MFWTNLKGIIGNLPLALSDTDEVSGVSLNRLIIFWLALCIPVFGGIVLIFFHTEAIQFLGYWQASLATLTALISANVAKRYINIKGDNNNDQHNN